ncbi:unnamed protein product [Orchesella dallaii]|uniref:Odorant receptor n=1 Tax=Orchesella dallaii TaxID=48710 RepID=A0ABP1SBC2_9HEXA
MLSPEYLDLISAIAWKVYEKIVTLQEFLWINLPIRWDSKKKQATYRTILRCLPYILFSIAQIPNYLYSFLILYRQVTPKYSDPRFSTSGAFIIAFGSLLNVFITFGSFANIYKRKEWCLCLNVVGKTRFSSTNIGKVNWFQKPLWKNITPIDILSNVIVGFLLILAYCGVFIGMFQDIDPIHYFFLDVPRGSTNWNILKYGIRPFVWGNWSMYILLTFFNTSISIIFLLLYGCLIIPRAPKLSRQNASINVIPTILSNLSVEQKLNLRQLEAAYKKYRQFQIFIRPANDAMYIVVPGGLALSAVMPIVCGVISIKGYSILSIGIFLLYPAVGIMAVILIITIIPIASGVFEIALHYKVHWRSRILRKEQRKRLRACRPMGIAAGPFGYVQRSLPMEILNSVVQYTCSIILTFSFDAHRQ